MVKSAEGCVCWWAGKKKNWIQGRRAEQQAGTRQHFQSNGCGSTSLSKVQNFSFDQLTHNHSEKGVPGNTVAAFPGIYSTKWPQLTLWPWLALCCTFFLAHYLFVGFILAVICGTTEAGTAPMGHGELQIWSYRLGKDLSDTAIDNTISASFKCFLYLCNWESHNWYYPCVEMSIAWARIYLLSSMKWEIFIIF